jgi:hypothetical protein
MMQPPPKAPWTHVALLGLFVLVLFDFVAPWILEWWANTNARDARHLDTAGAMSAAFQNVVALHAILPLRIIGGVAAAACALVAALRFAAQRRR